MSENSQEITYARVFLFIKLHTKVRKFINNETLAQVFSRKFCKVFLTLRNTTAAASVHIYTEIYPN